MSLKFPLTSKIGEVPPEHDKFAGWSANHGYYNRDPVTTSAFQTEKMMKGTFTKDDLILNKMVTTGMFTKNKSQVEYKGKTGGSSTNLLATSNNFGKTNIAQHFVDHKHYLRVLRENGSLENWQRSFEKYLKLNPVSTLTRSRELNQIISLFDIDLVVRDCIGEDAPEFILDKFKELGNAVAVHGEVAWSDFATVVEKVYKAVDSECQFHNELPPLILLMNKPKAVDKNLGALGDMSTTYRDNFGRSGGLSFSPSKKEDIYYEKPRTEIGSDLNNSAKILYAGTTKGTHHLPGFRGHIPVNTRNTRKAEHGSGKVPHPVVNDLVLTQRGMGCVLGYTGMKYSPFPFVLIHLICDRLCTN